MKKLVIDQIRLDLELCFVILFIINFEVFENFQGVVIGFVAMYEWQLLIFKPNNTRNVDDLYYIY